MAFTSSHFINRRVLVLLVLLGAVALVFAGRWLNANDVSAFLITGPEGHVVLDGGYPTTAPMIMASIAKLGFDIKDVKVLLNSEAHPDHGGGLPVLQQASGAQLWASEAIPADIWVTCHARAWGRYRKFVASKSAKIALDPFIDPDGYRAYIDDAEADFRKGVVH